MNHTEKKKILKDLNEKELRQEVIIPILNIMGYKAPVEYHGINEKGKDIICFDYDKLKEKRFLSVVVKKEDITGDVSSNRSLREQVYQVEQSFNIAYDDVYNMRQVYLDEVWIVTTGKLTSGAQESVIDTLRKNNLDKRVKIIYDDYLVNLIDNYFSSYWYSGEDTREHLIIQRDRIINFIEKLLKFFHIEKSDIETIKTQLLYSDFETRIKNISESFYLSSANAYSINMAEISDGYNDYIYSPHCGLIKYQFAKVKEILTYSMYEVDEILYNYEKVVKLNNPKEFIAEFNSLLKDDYPFWKGTLKGEECLDELESLEYGIEDVDFFKKDLKKKNKLDWANKLFNSVLNLKHEVEDIFTDLKNKEYIEIQYGIKRRNSQDEVFIIYQIDSNEVLFKVKMHRIKEFSLNPVSVEDVIKSSLYSLRKYIEKIIQYDESIYYNHT